MKKFKTPSMKKAHYTSLLIDADDSIRQIFEEIAAAYDSTIKIEKIESAYKAIKEKIEEATNILPD